MFDFILDIIGFFIDCILHGKTVASLIVAISITSLLVLAFTA